jgi:hypothetical protein
MERLIGQRFTRNKYGKQDWVDTVTDVFVRMNFVHDHYISCPVWEPKIVVKGTKGISYELDEIKLLNLDAL